MAKTFEIPTSHPYHNEFSEYSELLIAADYAGSSYTNYMSYVEDFLTWLINNNKNYTLEELPWKDLREYQTYLKKDKNLKGNTVNQHFSAIKMMMGGVVERTWNDKAVHNLKYEIYEGAVPIESEVVKILSAAKNRRIMLENAILAFCGLRISELVRLRWEHIRRERGTLYILPSKNHQDREVPLPTKILDELTAYCKSLYPKQNKTDFIFGGKCKDGSVTPQTIENHLNEITEYLGWKDRGYTCHSLRRYFGCAYYLAHPDDLPALSTIMGHRCVSSTMVYIRLAASYKARLADNDRINAIFGKVESSWKK